MNSYLVDERAHVGSHSHEKLSIQFLLVFRWIHLFYGQGFLWPRFDTIPRKLHSVLCL